MLGVCIIIYPEMQTQMGDIGEMFSDMGAFSDAFGMDMLNFGEFIRFLIERCFAVLVSLFCAKIRQNAEEMLPHCKAF